MQNLVLRDVYIEENKTKILIIFPKSEWSKGEDVATFLTDTAAIIIVLHRLYMRLQLITFIPDIHPLILHDLLKGKNRKSDRVSQRPQDLCKLNKMCYQLWRSIVGCSCSSSPPGCSASWGWAQETGAGCSHSRWTCRMAPGISPSTHAHAAPEGTTQTSVQHLILFWTSQPPNRPHGTEKQSQLTWPTLLESKAFHKSTCCTWGALENVSKCCHKTVGKLHKRDFTLNISSD